MSNLARYSDPNFLASDQDILHVRVVTQSVQDHVFSITINGLAGKVVKNFHLYDVSGLRNHRKHWMAYFAEVHSVMFVASLVSYDQLMVEDRTTNRMTDAIQVYN